MDHPNIFMIIHIFRKSNGGRFSCFRKVESNFDSPLKVGSNPIKKREGGGSSPPKVGLR